MACPGERPFSTKVNHCFPHCVQGTVDEQLPELVKLVECSETELD